MMCLGKTPRYQHTVIILSVLKLEELCSVIYTQSKMPLSKVTIQMTAEVPELK